MEATAHEIETTSGAVQAVAQHDDKRYSIKVGGEWYGGFGTCPVAKGEVAVIEYTVNGRYRNIKRVRGVGEAVAESRLHVQRHQQEPQVTLDSVQVAVMNYLTETGWRQAVITPEDDERIQAAVARRNEALVAECLQDAKRLLADAGVGHAVTPRNVVELALFLAERRIVHISTVYQEHLKAKVEAERKALRGGPREPRDEGEA